MYHSYVHMWYTYVSFLLQIHPCNSPIKRATKKDIKPRVFDVKIYTFIF